MILRIKSKSDRMNYMQKKDWVFVSLICFVSIIFMIPRLLSAQFGLLDDGVLLLNAKASLTDPSLLWSQFQMTGRFVPVASFLRALFFYIAGFSPLRWYLLSLLELLIIVLLIYLIARANKASRLQILFSVLIFIASPSSIENFYTLGKSEIPLLIFISSAIVLSTRYSSSLKSLSKAINIIFTFIMLLLGFCAKETANILPFVFLLWVIISYFAYKKSGEDRENIKRNLILLICSLISCAVYWALRNWFGITNLFSGTYTEGYQVFNFNKIITNFSILIGWIIRDFPYLIPVVLSVLLIKPLRQSRILSLLLKWGVWCVAWAGVNLPWNYVSYYFLPFLFGTALISGFTFGKVIELLWVELKTGINQTARIRWSNSKRFIFYGLLGSVIITSLLIVPPVLNTYAYAAEQLTFDRANDRFIRRVIKLPQGSVLYIDLPEKVEYFSEIKLLVGQIYNRKDLIVKPYQPFITTDNNIKTYIASPIYLNQVLPRVRAMNGPDIATWRACIDKELFNSHTIFATRINIPIIDIGLHRILFHSTWNDLIGFSDRKIIENKEMTYGWDIVEFIDPNSYSSKPGVYQDGIFVLQTITGNLRSVAFGQGNETPLTADVNGDDFTDLVLYDEKTNTWQIDTNLDGKPEKKFTINKMLIGDIPLIGDWDGDGKATPGFFRPTENGWYLYNNSSEEPSIVFQFGKPSETPLIGDWDGNGNYEVGLYNPETGYTYLLTDITQLEKDTVAFNGLPGATVIPGFWDDFKETELAFVKENVWNIYFPITGCIPPNSDENIHLDYSGIPIAGIWQDN